MSWPACLRCCCCATSWIFCVAAVRHRWPKSASAGRIRLRWILAALPALCAIRCRCPGVRHLFGSNGVEMFRLALQHLLQSDLKAAEHVQLPWDPCGHLRRCCRCCPCRGANRGPRKSVFFSKKTIMILLLFVLRGIMPWLF